MKDNLKPNQSPVHPNRLKLNPNHRESRLHTTSKAPPKLSRGKPLKPKPLRQPKPTT